MKNIIILFGILMTFSSCVQETHQKVITFKIDMNAVENVANVGLKGNFTNPSWKQFIPMTDDNNDGVYEVTLTDTTAVNNIRFKFVNQNDQFELKNQPNRILNFEYKPETLTYEATFNVAEGKTSNTNN